MHLWYVVLEILGTRNSSQLMIGRYHFLAEKGQGQPFAMSNPECLLGSLWAEHLWTCRAFLSTSWEIPGHQTEIFTRMQHLCIPWCPVCIFVFSIARNNHRTVHALSTLKSIRVHLAPQIFAITSVNLVQFQNFKLAYSRRIFLISLRKLYALPDRRSLYVP